MNYHLTKRGRLLINTIIFILLIGAAVSGNAIVQYFNVPYSSKEVQAPITDENTADDVVKDEAQTLEKPMVEKKESSESQPVNESAQIYTKYELEDFKLFKVILYFESNHFDLTPDVMKELDYLIGVLKTYPEEPITIESYLSSPSINNEKNLVGKKRLDGIENYLVKNAIEANRIQLKSNLNGTPLSSYYDNEKNQENILIYFTNHAGIAQDEK